MLSRLSGWCLASTLVLLNTGLTSAQPADDALEKSVSRALAFLEKVQEPDGAWRLSGGKSTAATSLAVMAFLSAGHVPGEGKYGQVIDKGIRYVVGAQRADGVLCTDSYEMYSHGISTLMLCEVAGMTDAALGAKVRTAVEKAVQLILKAQRQGGTYGGGWRYSVVGHDADMSVTGWQLLALKAARNLGCDVPAARIQSAVGYIKSSHEKATGGFGYTVNGPVTAPCTATAVLCLELCEGHQTDLAKRGGAFLLKHPPTWNQMYFFYNIYYCAQATFQLGGNYWDFYRPRLHKVLLDHQHANGSWLHPQESSWGPVYATAMSVLALTVEYRFLPIYQRGDD